MRIPTVIAHRGSSHRAPENTLAAFDAALEEDPGAGLELDVQLSRDRRVHVLHDETVDRTTDGRGALRDLDSGEIERLDAGYHFRDEQGEFSFRDRGVRVPSLREVLRRYPRTWLSIDLKQGGRDVEEAVARLLVDEDALGRCVVGAENGASARRLRRRLSDGARFFFDRPSVVVFYLRSRTRLWWGYRPPAHSLQIPSRSGRIRLDHPRIIEDAHRRGVDVVYWTIDEVDEMRRLLDRGADALVTNRPGRLRRLIDEEALS